jgi:hypothetical protein
MDLKVLTTEITETVTKEEIKGMIGYLGTDQDDRIDRLITVAREWLEERTGLSCIAKSYKVYFEREDADSKGWYELPMSPVASDPEITVDLCGDSSTFQQKGMNKVKIKPDDTFGTLKVGSDSDDFYLEVTFTAGASNKTADECIRRIAATMFSNPEDGSEVAAARLTFDTLRLIDTIDQNTGL